MNSKMENRSNIPLRASRSLLTGAAVLLIIFMFSAVSVSAQAQFEKKPVSDVKISFTDNETDSAGSDYFGTVAKNSLGDSYSAVKIRQALQALYDTKRIESAAVEVLEDKGTVIVTFLIKKRTVVRKLTAIVGRTSGKPVTQDEVLFRLNSLSPGSSITEQTIRTGADSVIAYFYEKGYFNVSVSYEQIPLASKTEIELVFKVTPGDQARVSAFKIEIKGFDSSKALRSLKLRPGSLYSRDEMRKDFERVKKLLRESNFLAAKLQEPNPVLDRTSNSVEIEVKGDAGPPIDVVIESAETKLDAENLSKILPIKREGTLDYSAIIGGERRLEEKFQEGGYFFVDVSTSCSVEPAFREGEASYATNDTELLCSALSGAELGSRKVKVRYLVDLGRRLKLVDIRVKGLERFLVDDKEIRRAGDGANDLGRPLPLAEIRALLGSTEASLIGIVPYLGYGRGYTSSALLAEDEETIRSLLNELGYRSAKVGSRQGVSLTGDELIITFDVDAGPRTKVSSIEITGNRKIPTDILKAELEKDFPQLEGTGFSRALVRNVTKRIVEYYSREGFFETRVNYSIENVARAGSDDVKVLFKVESEGSKVTINQVVVTGSEKVSKNAILNVVNLKPGQLLRSVDIFSSEQSLYATDAFRKVEIKPVAARENANGEKISDVAVSVEEQAPRTITYGGGYSTDAGPFGAFDLRHYNLFGRLQQGGVRARISRLRQLVQFDFVNPRFIGDGRNPDGTKRFAPLTITAQLQRDTTITRFFRSAFDKGTFGVVQRIDASGNPIDEFGRDVSSPTINRLLLSAETSRTLSAKNRTIVFARYRYEDVRLSNIDSLLIRDLLSPDARVRISGFGTNIVRDTRENCRLRYSLIEIATKGTAIQRCRYNPGDATKGDYLTADYSVSVPALGANTGFHKFQATYNIYYTPGALKNTTLAGRAVLGVSKVFSRGSRFRSSGYPELDDVLPISERFFAGGSQSLRGFDFESAGPRVLVVPQGTFRDSSGRIVRINPFTVPYGGNAIAMINLEARIPVSESVRLVPFYDGGNVFRTSGEIFKKPNPPANDVFRQNLKAEWTNTLGFGFRLKTPIGGELGVDYGYLLNPPAFLVPQSVGPNALYTPHRGQIHFRFAQAF